MNKKLYIIVGHYGSGKSEFSVNFAKKLKKNKKEVCLADLDIVNPYFRSREARLSLMNLGIAVVSDTLNSVKGLDMPYLSPAIKGQIVHNKNNLILDCGGDEVGVRVLKQFYNEIIERDFEIYMVINVYRPETSNVEAIIKMKNQLENEIGLPIKGYINNSNFLRQTSVDDIIYSDKILKEVSEITQVPILYVSALEKLIKQLPNDVSGERFILNLSLRNDWL
ncbi:ATP-binding protein [Mycoplasmatota bacterium]|nr:ATP-binding protein [Mycoplasmatota bacterium]